MLWDLDRLIPKADRKKIHEYLFREGVLVAKKDFNLPKHQEIDTKNLYVRLELPPTSADILKANEPPPLSSIELSNSPRISSAFNS